MRASSIKNIVAKATRRNRVVGPPFVGSASVNRYISTTPTRRAPEENNTESSPTVGEAENMSFMAETRQLLNIVTNSIYTDKHVFIRELISNACDALEKLRFMQMSGKVESDESPLQVSVEANAAKNTLTFTDNGIGMTKAELVKHLGTIAHSGSKAFVNSLANEAGEVTASSSSSIIGQFGVGFYSAFMVAEKVEVFSQSALPGEQGYLWSSSGDGNYSIAPISQSGDSKPLTRGCRIVLHLKKSCSEFSRPETVRDTLMKYSNFGAFPIYLNGRLENTVQAIWLQPKSDVSEEQYDSFFQYKSGMPESPLLRLHFSTDAPTSIRALLFVGRTHMEKMGMGRMKSGVDLYSRRVLIEAHSKVLPEWLRFLHGVVDSEDIPLSLSRENMQDSALLARLRAALTRRILRFFDAESRRDRDMYNKKFFPEFGSFLKEGLLNDDAYVPELGKLLRFESSALEAGEVTSLDEYISRMPVGQTEIYFICAPSRESAQSSPYMEAFQAPRNANATASADTDAASKAEKDEIARSSDIEVLYLFNSLDEFAMGKLREFSGKKIVSVENATADYFSITGTPKPSNEKQSDNSTETKTSEDSTSALPLDQAKVDELGKWIQSHFPSRVKEVKYSTRLRNTPMIVTDHESASLLKYMKLMEQQAGGGDASSLFALQNIEINPNHNIIKGLYYLKDKNPEVAKLLTAQVIENAFISAGLVEDTRSMIPRLNNIIDLVLKK